MLSLYRFFKVVKSSAKAGLLCCLVLISFAAAHADVDDYESVDTPRFTLFIEAQEKNSLVTPALFKEDITKSSIDELNKTYDELSRIFQTAPQKKVILRFLSPEEFRRQTGSPSWTSAMYFQNEITIPIDPSGLIDEIEIRRALRHEYVHAVIAELSDSKCPAWLDEGLAQLIEGKPNPLLGPALRNWMPDNEALPLSWLNYGFTTLDSSIVPVAYAQSLFAARTIVNTLGFTAIRNYLFALRQGVNEEEAFSRAFHSSKSDFENKLTVLMKRWVDSELEHP